MGPDPGRRLPPPLWLKRGTTIAVLLLPVLIVSIGAFALLPGQRPGRGAVGPGSGTVGPGAAFSVSYGGAAGRLKALPEDEREEQLRDWARTALAARLGLDAATLQAASYDTVPLREQGLTDLAAQPTGPGRALYDARTGTLHLLVPRDDHISRTIGGLLDQYRADHGSDPRSVQVHHYQIRPDLQAILLTGERPRPAGETRATNGYVTARVDTVEGLRGFLERTRHLSRLWVKGQELWADGWRWPHDPAPAFSESDVATLQRAYAPGGARPGFSLDRLENPTSKDLGAALPGVNAGTVRALAAGNWGALGFGSAAEFDSEIVRSLATGDTSQRLTRAGLRADRTQLFALLQLASSGGKAAFEHARYDGPLGGTEIGMTLFYTDLMAKSWSIGTGRALPDKGLKGFPTYIGTKIPLGHCVDLTTSETWRLWFAQNPTGFSFADDRLDIGARATQLFMKSESGAGSVDPDYRAARGLGWWERHFQEIADFEPQYARLEQIMRWSGALDWLRTRPDAPGLAEPTAEVDRGLRFDSWFKRHEELKERATPRFVHAPSAKTEVLLTEPAKPFKTCGFPSVSGGVGLAELAEEAAGRQPPPNAIPNRFARSGLFDPRFSRVDSTGKGRLRQEWQDDLGNTIHTVERRLSSRPDGTVVAESRTKAARTVSFGGLKLRLPRSASHTVRIERQAGKGVITENVRLQGQDVGSLRTSVTGGGVFVRWVSGTVDRVRRMMDSVQDRLARGRGGTPARGAALIAFKDENGQIVFKAGDGTSSAQVTDHAPGSDRGVVFQLGAPGPNGTVRQMFGVQRPFHPPGKGPGRPRGPPPGDWLEFAGEGADGPVVAVAGTPRENAGPTRVETADGQSFDVMSEGDRVWASRWVFSRSVAVAAVVRDLPHLKRVQRDARTARDGDFRGVQLGPDGADGVALVSADRIIAAPPGHQMADRVQQAMSPDASAPPHMQLVGDRAVHHEEAAFHFNGEREDITVGQAANRASLLASERMRDLVDERGIPRANPRNTTRRVLLVHGVIELPESANPQTPPDRVTLRNGSRRSTLVQIGGPGWGSAPADRPAPGGGPAPPDSVGDGIVLVPVQIVCPDEDPTVEGCPD